MTIQGIQGIQGPLDTLPSFSFIFPIHLSNFQYTFLTKYATRRFLSNLKNLDIFFQNSRNERNGRKKIKYTFPVQILKSRVFQYIFPVQMLFQYIQVRQVHSSTRWPPWEHISSSKHKIFQSMNNN